MKSMKFILQVILLLGANYAIAQTHCSSLTIPNYPTFSICGNYKSGTIYTPNNTPVSVLQMSGSDFISQSYKDDMKNAALTYYNDRITFEAEATGKYNCHAHAWANTNVWINTPDQKKYWTDYSYVELNNSTGATKVSYGSVDHSAVTTSTANNFSSKWSGGPQFKHSINDSPYLPTDLHYYVLKPTLSGSAFICSGSSYTFSVSNAPSGFTWSKSSNLNVSGTGTSVSVTKSGSDGAGWVSINYGGIELVKKDVYVGIPVIGSSIGGPSTVANSQINTFNIATANDSYNFSWTATGGYYSVSSTYYSGSANYAEMYFSPPGSRTLQVYASNSCGSCSPVYKGITVTGGGSDTLKSAVYPNPATDIIKINIERKTESLYDNPIPSATTYDIRIYDVTGILRRQTKTIIKTTQMNVSDLSNGVYFLYIYDGINSKPEIQKILIAH